MSEVNLNPVDAGQGGIVDTNTNTNTDNIDTSTANGGSEPIDSQSNAKPVQDKQTNDAFAEMRRGREAAETKAAQVQRDFEYFQKYSGLGITSEAELAQKYGHEGINTWEDVDRYYEAQEKNIDPELYNRVIQAETTSKETMEKLKQYERKETMQLQEEELSKDTKVGSFFNANKEEIKTVANHFNIDLDTALTMVMRNKYAEPNLEEIKQNAIKEYIEKVKSGNAPIETSGGNTSSVVSGSKTFEDARKGAIALLRASKQF